MKPVSVILIFALLNAARANQECEAPSVCSPSQDCEYYQQQLKNITNVQSTAVKNQIFQHLRYCSYFDQLTNLASSCILDQLFVTKSQERFVV